VFTGVNSESVYLLWCGQQFHIQLNIKFCTMLKKTRVGYGVFCLSYWVNEKTIQSCKIAYQTMSFVISQ
jgi:hypothetical protein